LNCPSLDFVEDMSWREFQLRLAGYIRQQKEKWIHTREVVYYTLVSSGSIKPEKLSKEKFMPLESNGKVKSGGLNDRQKELMKEALNKALNG